ncbi:MAG TPA: hypothetical protein VGC82_13585, partial [Rhodopila sp.]
MMILSVAMREGMRRFELVAQGSRTRQGVVHADSTETGSRQALAALVAAAVTGSRGAFATDNGFRRAADGK